jgi:hypothetical protein
VGGTGVGVTGGVALIACVLSFSEGVVGGVAAAFAISCGVGVAGMMCSGWVLSRLCLAGVGATGGGTFSISICADGDVGAAGVASGGSFLSGVCAFCVSVTNLTV